MHVSLVVATVERVMELDRLLASLADQTYREFDVVVVDQNPDDRLAAVLERYSGAFSITYHRAESRGVSRARNLGEIVAKGDIISFPDDDCWYAPDLLWQVVSFFSDSGQYDGLTGRVVDETGTPSVGCWDKQAGEISRFNEWRRSAESVIFLRRRAFISAGGFDKHLGPGAGTPWGACEGDDLILRALNTGSRIYYDPTLQVFHPATRQLSDPASLQKAYAYSRGMGRVMRLHNYPFWFVSYYCLRSLGGAVAALLKGDRSGAKYYLITLKGRISGWIGKA